MGKKSKTKGSSYELKIAKMFTCYWDEGDFHRVPASGGLHWGSDQRVAGDIVPPEKADFPFVIECKKREEWTMDHILLDIGQPKEWWAQVVGDARRIHKVPILIFSRNRAKDFVMLPYERSLYLDCKLAGADVMITEVTIKNIRDEEQIFEVIVTTMDTLTRLHKEVLKTYADRVVWDAYAEGYK